MPSAFLDVFQRFGSLLLPPARLSRCFLTFFKSFRLIRASLMSEDHEEEGWGVGASHALHCARTNRDRHTSTCKACARADHGECGILCSPHAAVTCAVAQSQLCLHTHRRTHASAHAQAHCVRSVSMQGSQHNEFNVYCNLHLQAQDGGSRCTARRTFRR